MRENKANVCWTVSLSYCFRGPTGSAGQLAATHSQAFDNWFANCPGLKVIVPQTHMMQKVY